MRTRALRLAAIPIAFAALASTATAAEAMTVRLGTPDLSNRIEITVPVTVSCSPFDPPREQFNASASVSVRQASGRDIARGSGAVFSFLPAALLFPCDGDEHTVPVVVLADVESPPFHGGGAVITASASAGAGISCNPQRTCWFDIVGQSAALAPTTLRLH